MKKHLLFLLFFHHVTVSFDTISDAISYARKLPEYPANDTSNWLYPNYQTTYKKIRPNFIDRFFKTKNRIPSQLQNALANIIKNRPQKTPYIIKLVCQPECNIFIWGDLHSAFHSMVRDITFLMQQKVIDNNFKIHEPYYFVINGNAINQGPYNSEMLLLLIRLLQQNPERVFYIRGTEETDYRWTNGVMKEELQYRAAYLSPDEIPLQKPIQQLFNTLPDALFITTARDQHSFICITTYDDNIKIFDGIDYVHQIKQKTTQKLTYIQPKKIESSRDNPLTIIASIQPINWHKDTHIQTGVDLIGQDMGATVWTTFSSPIEVYQKLLNFKRDAFGLLTITDPLNQSTITLYSRELTPDARFKITPPSNIQFGNLIQKDNRLYATKTINLGSSMALVQGVPIMGERTQRGMMVRLNKENQRGGIGNHFVRSIIYNDNYTPFITRENINRLLQQHIDTILLPVGSPTLNAYLDYIKDGKVAVLFPITGGPQFRDPALKGILHFRATYADEVHALINYMITERSITKFAFFYQDDAYGIEPLKAAEKELKKHGITEWTKIPYQRNSVSFPEQAQKLKEALPDAIGFFATAQASRDLMRQVGIDFFVNKQLFGISFLGEESFRKFLKDQGLTLLFGAVVPNPYISNVPIVQEYRAAMDMYGYPYDVFSLEAYIATSILVDALKKISPPVTKEKILHALESYNNYNFKGLHLTFHPQRRDLANFVWLETGDDKEWIKKEIDKNAPSPKDQNVTEVP